jgi:hypothetical protein
VLSLSRARALGVAGITALGLGAAGSLIDAPVSLANAPTTGAACQSSDGKINARGSTLQSWLQEDLIGAYASDVCGYVSATATGAAEGNLQDSNNLYFQDTNAGTGPASGTPTDQDPTDPYTTSVATTPNAAPFVNTSGTTEPYYKSDWMISYNPYEAYNYSATGSTQGRAAIGCRTDAFTGTDIPYVMGDWNAINGVTSNGDNGAPSEEAGLLGKNCAPTKPGAPAPFDSTFYTSSPAESWTPAFEAEPSGGFGNQSDPQGAANPVTFAGSPTGGALLSFPVGISAVGFPLNLQTGTNGSGKAEYCGTTSTTKPAVDLSVADIAGLLGGVITNVEQLDGGSGYGGSGTYALGTNTYNDAGENPALLSCNITVTRVVRYDGSGTTQAVLNFLNDALTSSGAGTGGGSLSSINTCNTSNSLNATFGDLESQVVTTQNPTLYPSQAGTNDLWPGEGDSSSNITKPVATAAGGGCTAVIPGGSSGTGTNGINGGPALLQTLEATSGGIGYADVSDIEHDSNTSSLILPKVEISNSPSLNSATNPLGYNSSVTSSDYASPEGITGGSTKASNCSLGTWANPTGAGDMGLDGEWALDYGSPGTFNTSNYDDIAWQHENAYGACTLTWDFAWGNQGTGDAGADPEPELDADQRRTLYSYFTYVYSDAAQSTYQAAGYENLPQNLIDTFRTEFQAAF